MKQPQFFISFALAFMCGWLVTSHFTQNAKLNEIQRRLNTPVVSNSIAPPVVPLLSNAAIAEAATQLFVKEQQQSLQQQVETFLILTEPLLLSTNLDRPTLSKAISNAEVLHSKIDPNNFNPILEIRFDARRGTLQSLVNQ